ncbi:MAG: hypothetical protein M3362_09365, partial [Acidobacteriota bacterium]|nr:hypothetical protein [Acidobacteriota bacterium]
MRRHKRFATLLAALSITAAPHAAPSTGTAAAQVPVAKSAPAREATPELRRETFEIVWRTIKEKHFDPKFNGVDWDKVHDLYAPRVQRVKNDEEFYKLLQEMLGELHQSHFVVLPPEYTHKPESKEEVEAGLGVSIRIIDDRVVIWRVLANSPAARASLRPGFVIKEIDGQSVQKIIAPIKRRKETPASVEGRIIDTIAERFLGAAGSSVRLVYLDEKDHRRDLTIRREKLQGEMSPPVGDFPSFLTEFESKRLAGGTGYIRFTV